MGDVKLSRRRFLEKMAPAGGSVRIEPVSPLPAEDLFKVDEHAFSNRQLTLQGGLDPYQGPWTQAQAAHLLRRTTFGVKYAQVQQLLALGNAQAAVDAILNVPTTPPDPPINNYNSPNSVPPYADPNVPSGQTWINAPYDVEAEGFRIESWRGWWLNRMIEGEANIQEKMTLFWHNHFATQTDAVFRGKAAYLHNAMLRRNILGNFRTFVKEVTLDPLMLVFLNGFRNNLIAPDENYARELQELFTIGKDTQQGYTEDDVVAAARVLTGWTVDINGTVTFVPQLHDQGFKVFSSFYGNTIIQGSNNGSAELDALINMILQKEEVSLYISRKLYRFFVYYEINQDVEANVIVPMAQIFRDNNYEIKPVVKALLQSEHFFDAVNKGCMIKNPLDMLVGMLRNYNLTLPAPTLLDNYSIRLGINYYCNALQMMPGSPPNVAGWSAYRQIPTYYRNWISADTIRNRNIISDVMAFGGVDVGPEKLFINHIAFAAQFPNPGDPNALIDNTLAILHPMPISTLKKFYLKSILLSGQLSDHYWTDAWNAYVNNPSDPMAAQAVWFRLATMHKYIMNLAEYQLS